MDPRFNRFVKETKAEQLKRERAERKALKEKKGSDCSESDSSKKLEDPLKTKKSSQPSQEQSWEEGGLWAWSNDQRPESEIKEKEIKKVEEEDPKSLFEIFRSQGDKKWLGQDYPATRGAFNLINKSLHPEKPLAEGVAVLAAKGTSFEDKRIACLETLRSIRAGTNTGEVKLVPEPNNPHDPNAVGIFDAQTNRQLGFIPKAKEVNQVYAQSINEGKLVGAYIIDGKETYLKGEENALLIIATGWIY